MADNTKKSSKPAEEGFLTTAAQAIGTTLGQLAKKAGVAGSPAPAKRAIKKAAAKGPAKKPAVKKKTAAKKPK